MFEMPPWVPEGLKPRPSPDTPSCHRFPIWGGRSGKAKGVVVPDPAKTPRETMLPSGRRTLVDGCSGGVAARDMEQTVGVQC